MSIHGEEPATPKWQGSCGIGNRNHPAAPHRQAADPVLRGAHTPAGNRRGAGEREVVADAHSERQPLRLAVLAEQALVHDGEGVGHGLARRLGHGDAHRAQHTLGDAQFHQHLSTRIALYKYYLRIGKSKYADYFLNTMNTVDEYNEKT